MWWLLVPVIGAVVAAVASSGDDDETASTERRAHNQAREAEDQAITRHKQENLKKRRAQLVADVNDQLNELFTSHSSVIERADSAVQEVKFEHFQAFALKKVPSRPQTMLKHLESIAPGTTFSPIWKKHANQARALQDEILSLQNLKEELRI